MAIKAVFFDLYNTLARFDPPAVDIQLAVGRELGLPVTREGLAQGYVAADAFMAQEDAIRPLIQRDREERRRFFGQYERLVLQGAGIELSPAEALNVFRQVQRRPLEMALYDDAEPALKALEARGKTLGLITNINLGPAGGETRMDAILGSLGLDRYLSVTVTSMEIGIGKPHPPIFQAALRKAGVQPHEAVHVGDQYDSDIVGARRAGIAPVLLDRAGAHPDYGEGPRLESLKELPALVEEMEEG
ncbi:MAG: HAD family hydrolase [Chloroflexi bacterium]|nr:HAD family hydrolase [Chloroflexota bacterium]